MLHPLPPISIAFRHFWASSNTKMSFLFLHSSHPSFRQIWVTHDSYYLIFTTISDILVSATRLLPSIRCSSDGFDWQRDARGISFSYILHKNGLHFQILAQMHGYIHYKNKATVILESVGLVSHANKLVRYYRWLEFLLWLFLDLDKIMLWKNMQ